MIREDEVREAIAECQGERNPNANTCIKLAAYYTILNNMTKPGDEYNEPTYSFDAGDVIRYNSGTEFSDTILGKNVVDVLEVMDELMDTVAVLLPRLYRATIDELKS